MVRARQVGLLVLAVIASAPASAEPVRSVAATGLPSNPFASNYPSDPPVTVRHRRTRAAVRRPTRTRSSSEPLLPPGEIPAARRAK